MELYLAQHGKARSKEEDPERPLTPDGRREVDAVMLLMMRFNAIHASRVLHSGKRRAEETARIIADKLDADIDETDGLAPNDDPALWRDRLRNEDRDVVLVGHLPHLDRLASTLLCGDPEARLVEFVNGGVVCLRRSGDRWALAWSIPPALVQ